MLVPAEARAQAVVTFGDLAGTGAVWAETFGMALAGTAMSALAALVLAPAASRHSPPLLHLPLRAALALIRALPCLAVAALLVLALGGGAATGALAIGIVATGSLALHLAGAIDRMDDRPARALESAGANAAQRLRFAIWPQFSGRVGAALLVGFARNLREALLVGLVGAGGLGAPLFAAIAAGRLGEASALLLAAALAVALAEGLGRSLRRQVAL